MPAAIPSLLTRISYGARQLPRVAWYVGHSLALRRLSEATRREEGKKAWRPPQTDLPVPDRNQIYADMADLFLQDLANVEAGLTQSRTTMTAPGQRSLGGRDCSLMICQPSMSAESTVQPMRS
jgi:hypothetical protein